jgi:hypothetical protein
MPSTFELESLFYFLWLGLSISTLFISTMEEKSVSQYCFVSTTNTSVYSLLFSHASLGAWILIASTQCCFCVCNLINGLFVMMFQLVYYSRCCLHIFQNCSSWVFKLLIEFWLISLIILAPGLYIVFHFLDDILSIPSFVPWNALGGVHLIFLEEMLSSPAGKSGNICTSSLTRFFYDTLLSVILYIIVLFWLP